MINCPRCKLPQDDEKSLICKYCGYEIGAKEKEIKKASFQSPKKITIVLLIQYLFGGLLILSGIFGIVSEPIMAFSTILMGILIFPQIVPKIEKRYNFVLTTPVKVLIIIICLTIIGIINQEGKEKQKLDTINERKSNAESAKTQNNKIYKTEAKKVDCWEAGFKAGFCSTLTFHGRDCAPEDDIILPDYCRGERETAMGIKRGVESAYKKLGIHYR